MARDSRYGQIATDIAIMLLGVRICTGYFSHTLVHKLTILQMGLSYWVVQYGLSKIDMDNGAADAKKRKATAAAVMQRIDQRERRVRAENDDFEETIHESNQALLGPRKEDLVLNQYEQTIASEVVAPEDIAVGFEGRQSINMKFMAPNDHRYWRPGKRDRRAQGGCYIPTHYAKHLFPIVSSSLSTFRSSSLWSTRMRKDYASEGAGQRKRCKFYKPTHLYLD